MRHVPAPAARARSDTSACACAALACVAVPCARCVRAQQSSDEAGPTSIVHAPTRLCNQRRILDRCANAMCGHAVRDRALLASARHDRALCAQVATMQLCMFALCALVFCMCAMRALAFCVLGQCTCAGACSRATCRRVRASCCRLPHRLACLWRHAASFVSDVAHTSTQSF